MLLLTLAFTAFPDKTNALLSNKGSDMNLKIEASGSLGFFSYDSVCVPTLPNYTLVADRKYDWCSNLATEEKGMPWVQYHFPHKQMKLTGYALRNGCCDYVSCCCEPETGKDLDYVCCCRLYSFSLLGSNDNKTWVTIHSVEKDSSFLWCQTKEFEFEMTRPFNYIRFRMDQERPGCPKCMQVNQIELYGEIISSPYGYSTLEDEEENEESISIIGKVKKY